MKRYFLLTLVFACLLVGCQKTTSDKPGKSSLPTEIPATGTPLLPVENTPVDSTAELDTETAAEQAATETSTEQNPENSGSTQFEITTPVGWFSTQNMVADMQTVLYTSKDPYQMKEENELGSIPLDFAVGGLAISPLPENSDPLQLQQGLVANIESYNVQDLESMLLIADKIGLIDLMMVENTKFVASEIDNLDGREALRMEGIIETQMADRLHVQVWLTWTNTSFVSLYEFAIEDYWPTAAKDFSEVRKSIRLLD